MKKRIALLTAAALLLCCLFPGCGKKPDIVLNIKTPVFNMETVEGLEKAEFMYDVLALAGEAFAEQYTDANVTVNVSQFEQARKLDEIDGCFDTDKAPDVLWGGDLSSYTFTGRVASLDDVISDEVRSDISDAYWENCMVDGKTYLMPFFASQVVLCYNRELFRQAGLQDFMTEEDVVQNWTPEEWETVLSTLRAKLPSTIYPLMMYADSMDGDMHIMVMLRSQGSSFYDENGRVNLNTPQGIAGLEWIRDCNEKGYFPPNSANMVMLDCYELFMNGQLAIYCANVALQTLYDAEGIEYGMVNLPSPEGEGYNTTTTPGFMAFDNGSPEKLAAAKAFIKFIYESDFLDYSAGAIPVSRRVAEKYASQLQNVDKYIKNAKNNVNYTANNPNWNGVRAVFHQRIQDLLLGAKSPEQVAQELDEECNAAIEEGYKNRVLHD